MDQEAISIELRAIFFFLQFFFFSEVVADRARYHF